jgi:replicative DNA helicase
MELLEASEINVGLVLKNRLSCLAIRPETLMAPYDKIIKEIQKRGEVNMTDLAERFGPNIINAALHAVENMNGLGELAKWPKILENSYSSYEAGDKLEKLAKKLQQGQVIDWSQISILSRNAQIKLAENVMTLNDVEAGEMPFIKTGWKAIDDHIGGFPEIGLVIVGGRPGVGKTWFMVRTVTSFVKQHKDKNVAVFSLEMILAEIAARFKGEEIPESSKPTEEEQKRMFFCDRIMGADEIIQTCTTIPNLGLVCIDFADMMIKGEATEAQMAVLYKTLAFGAKELGCTIVLLAQLSRRNGIPKPSDLRYTGLAESLGWMIMMLYDPSKDWTVDENDKEDTLPVIDNSAYIICWKIRGGFRQHVDDSPGAICIPFKGKFGWHPRQSKWFTLKKYERT